VIRDFRHLIGHLAHDVGLSQGLWPATQDNTAPGQRWSESPTFSRGVEERRTTRGLSEIAHLLCSVKVFYTTQNALLQHELQISGNKNKTSYKEKSDQQVILFIGTE
jgi:hypothetical protein